MLNLIVINLMILVLLIFLKAKWYYSPLVFTESGKRIRPKEGRFVAFPAYLKHHVPKHRYKDTRITLSGNFSVPNVI